MWCVRLYTFKACEVVSEPRSDSRLVLALVFDMAQRAALRVGMRCRSRACLCRPEKSLDSSGFP